jgi:hypothetical protein
MRRHYGFAACNQVVPLVALVAAMVVCSSCANVITRVGRVTDHDGKPVSGATIQVIGIDGGNARIPERGTFLTQTGDTGEFHVSFIGGQGKQYRILASVDGFEPESAVFDGLSAGPLEFVLQREVPWQPRQFRLGEKVIARDGEWCNAEIVSVGTASSPTYQGAMDMSGRYEVQWDDWGDRQWLKEQNIRPRTGLKPSPVRCPTLTKAELGTALTKQVEKILGR